MDNVKEEKNLSLVKIMAIVLITLIIVPIILLSIVYKLNDNFKDLANQYLSQVPGPIGEHFSSYPTKEEQLNNIKKVSEYLLSLDENSSRDKLILIKNEDQQVYNEIIKEMLLRNKSKTTKIVDEVRKSSLRKDIILSTLEEIENEKLNNILSKVEYIEKAPTATVIEEIKTSIENNHYSFSEIAELFENLNNKKMIEILKYLDEETLSSILNNFSSHSKREEVRKLVMEEKNKVTQLINLASIYSAEEPSHLVDMIGNTNSYSIEELAIIYKHMDLIKGSLILSKVDDVNFIHELTRKIKEIEQIEGNTQETASSLIKGYQIYKSFDNNVKELATIYEKMDEASLSPIIQQLYRSNNQPKIYPINDSVKIIISDKDLALNILQNFNERKISKILSYMDRGIASDITKELALPN